MKMKGILSFVIVSLFALQGVIAQNVQVANDGSPATIEKKEAAKAKADDNVKVIRADAQADEQVVNKNENIDQAETAVKATKDGASAKKSCAGAKKCGPGCAKACCAKKGSAKKSCSHAKSVEKAGAEPRPEETKTKTDVNE